MRNQTSHVTQVYSHRDVSFVFGCTRRAGLERAPKTGGEEVRRKGGAEGGRIHGIGDVARFRVDGVIPGGDVMGRGAQVNVQVGENRPSTVK